MAIYHLQDTVLEKVPETHFKDENVREQQHLQAALKEQIDAIAPDCLVIAEEFSDWSGSQRRIDLLAIDQDANIVVIELKRTETGGHMELQAIRYAAMVSTLTFHRAVEIYQAYLDKTKPDPDAEIEPDAEKRLLAFLDWAQPDEEKFASDVRIVLVSEDFSPELTTSVMWLSERDLDIRCVRLTPHNFEGQILINVEQIIPLPEAENYQVRVREQSGERRQARKRTYDTTQYLFNGEQYGKSRLVLAVIQKWVADNQPQSYADLLEAFPLNVHNSKFLFVTLDEALDIAERHRTGRHFRRDGETIKFPDGTEYAVTNQWGIGNIGRFLDHAQDLGFTISMANKAQEERKSQRKKGESSRDRTQYLFCGKQYGKGPLVVAVIHKWIDDNQPKTYEDLLKAFPLDTHYSGHLFVPLREAEETRRREGQKRHFLHDDAIIQFDDSKYSITSQWGIGSIPKFLERAEELNLRIEALS